MSRYLLPENQRILWDCLRKIPVFQQYDQSDRETLFRKTMESIHHQYKGRELSLADLQHLNRETIAYVIHHIKTTYQNTMMPSTSLSSVHTSPVSKEYFAEQKHGEIQRKFDERQQEYSTMLKKDPPTTIDFREAKEIDKPIENMEELIRLQMMNRQLDVAVPPPTSSLREPVALDEPTIVLGQDLKKNVSWDLSKNEIAYIEPRSSEIQEIRDEITRLKSQFQDLNQKIEEIMEKILK
jgi:hypothetical protein